MNINSLLERADRVYRQLVSHRQPLDLLLNRLLEHGQQEPIQVIKSLDALSVETSTHWLRSLFIRSGTFAVSATHLSGRLLL